MNNTFEVLKQVIQSRRSIFPASYIEKDIPVEVIDAILESANYAPTHKLTEPWRFVVIRDGAKVRLGEELGRLYKEKISPEKYLQKKYDSMNVKAAQAACIIAICVQYHPGKVPAWEEVAAVASAVQNMALTAVSLDVGAYWSSPSLIDYLDGFLGLGENERCLGLFYMGYHEAPVTQAKRGDMSLKVRWMEQ